MVKHLNNWAQVDRLMQTEKTLVSLRKCDYFFQCNYKLFGNFKWKSFHFVHGLEQSNYHHLRLILQYLHLLLIYINFKLLKAISIIVFDIAIFKTK